ncbi:alpha-glucosidase [Kineosphaera limosa]|uniref:Putative glycoside hydrolase n=1 Tax=Kineosphaera limosa NBRC 100340 TaxID=1184609 RepID=K6WQM8_9MICO|nr:TIM-barrel domain-containing protein [Kineosphaera limosa]NYE03070.1 alpha-glucosidase [Kineosphaera limosa]GAB94407.1 putative glycoside hydrolase [Kineosphaera limosa NBRC 100340]
MRIARRLKDVAVRDGYATLRTDAVDIRLWFLTDDILRVRAGFGGTFAEASYSLVTTAWPDRLDDVHGAARMRLTPARFDLQEEETRVVVAGARLRVEVERDPLRLIVRDADGTVLHEDIAGLAYRQDPNGRRLHTSRIEPDDRFYGFGEKTGRLDKARQRLVMSPRDCMGYDPKETDSLYKHIPFYVRLGRRSRVAVGYFYHNTYECEFDLGRSRSNYWPPSSTYRTDGGDIDLFLIAGPAIRDVVRRYTQLTGTSAMLPKSALGYLGSSMYYPELPRGCDQAILNFVETSRAYEMPIDGFQLSSGYTQQETADGLKRCVFTWNDDRFGDPAAFFAAMAARGLTTSPNVKPGVLLVHPERDAMAAADLFVRDSAGDEPAVGMWWGGPGNFVDFTKPAARAQWARLLTEHVLAKGTASVWNDNCEYDSLVDLDARCDFDGAGGTIGQLKAVMANLMCQVTVEAIERHDPDARPFVVCRSGHAGIQRFAQTWSGDNETSWDSLEYNIATVLGMSLSGVANQGSDIGGFYGPAPDAELFVRWIQHGIFQPRFSIHSVNTDNTVTEPWMYSAHTDTIREAFDLRYRLFPYLYSLMARAHETGLPIVEPLCSAFQHDPACDQESVDFMLGDALLVANVVRPGATVRSVYLPADHEFFDVWTRQCYAGGQRIDVPVDLRSIPLFLRAGGIMALAENPLQNLATEQVTRLRLLCAPQRDGRFTLYEDDGVSTAYRRGESLTTQVAMTTSGPRTVLAFEHRGAYRSAVRTVHLDLVHPDKAPFWVRLDDAELPHLLDRRAFEQAEAGWYYSQTLRSVQITYPNPHRDHTVTVSFEHFDMIGI